MSRTIALVDFSYFLRVNYHARASDSGPNECGQHTLNQLSDWRRQFDHVIVALDSPPYWRKLKHDGYKAQRERDDAYIQICRWTKERLVADGYSIAAAPSFEADDVVATLADKLANDLTKVVILSADKDATQCIRRGVECWAPTGGGQFEVRDAAWVEKKWGILPDQVPMLLAICGDKSDNIPGIKGIGDKGAAKLINKYGTVEKMRLAAMAEFDDAKEKQKALPAFWQNFLHGSPDLPKWLELTTLRKDVPLDVDALMVKREPAPLVEDGMNDERGDAWEPSEEEMAEEREMLDPGAIISGPSRSQHASSATLEKPAPAAQSTANGTATAASVTGELEHDSNGLQQSSEDIVVSRVEPASWNLALQPRTANEALHIAKVLFNSRLCSQFGSERGVYAVISLGRELGLPMMTALQGFFIVNDKPFASAGLLRALAERDPNCEYIVCVESDDRKAVWETKHRKVSSPMRYTYTRERAEQAGMFTGKNAHNWKTKTQEMLEKTAGAKGARRWYPMATMGLHIPEELDE